MFLTGAVPVVVAILILTRVHETEKFQEAEADAATMRRNPLREILGPRYRRRTWVAAALVTIAIVGLWAGAVYEPSAVIQLAQKAGFDKDGVTRTASFATGLLSIGTILGCLALPPIAERIGRAEKPWRFTLPEWRFRLSAASAGRSTFRTAWRRSSRGCSCWVSFGGNFALFSLWLPEQFETRVRATAFAFCTSFGRFVGAGVNFLLGAAVLQTRTLGLPLALTAVAFVVGLFIIPLAPETRGEVLPD